MRFPNSISAGFNALVTPLNLALSSDMRLKLASRDGFLATIFFCAAVSLPVVVAALRAPPLRVVAAEGDFGASSRVGEGTTSPDIAGGEGAYSSGMVGRAGTPSSIAGGEGVDFSDMEGRGGTGSSTASATTEMLPLLLVETGVKLWARRRVFM